MEVQDLVVRCGGIASRSALMARGARPRELTAAARRGAVCRPRRGWYSILPASDPRVVAVRLGGRLTGSAALRLDGAWMWSVPAVDVLVPPWSSLEAPLPAGVRVHHSTAPGQHVVVPLREALRHALVRESFEGAVALLDWTLKTGRLSEFDVQEVVLSLPRAHQPLGAWVDPKCDSFLESVTRTRLKLGGHHVTSQVPVGELGAIDLVVDGVIGVETDGYRFHADTFERDRAKDLAILAEGRTAMRLSYALVQKEWPAIEAAIAVAVTGRRSARGAQGARITHAANRRITTAPGLALARSTQTDPPWRPPRARRGGLGSPRERRPGMKPDTHGLGEP